MSTLLERGLGALGESLRLDDVGASLERVEARRKGTLVFTLRLPEGTRWYRFDGQELKQLRPHKDRKVPLAKAYAERIEAGELKVLAWRPGRRICLLDTSGPLPRVLKGYRKGRSEGAERRYQTALRALRGREGLSLPSLVSRVESVDALVLEWIEGTPPALSGSEREVFREVGALLRCLQDLVEPDTLEPHGVDEELRVLEELAERVARTCPVPGPWRALYERLQSMAHLVQGRPLLATHRDLHDGQLLWDGDSLGLLDFDLFCAADPALDVANLTVHLTLRHLQGLSGASEAGAETCSRALIEGLGRSTEPGFRSALRFYQAATLLRLALVYRVRPRWAGVIDGLLVLAERCLEEVDD